MRFSGKLPAAGAQNRLCGERDGLTKPVYRLTLGDPLPFPRIFALDQFFSRHIAGGACVHNDLLRLEGSG
jgi:hypothetical protein